MYLIWSNEHQAWWRPGCWGYTIIVSQAGLFPEKEAQAICKEANKMGKENEVMVSAETFASDLVSHEWEHYLLQRKLQQVTAINGEKNEQEKKAVSSAIPEEDQEQA